MAGSFGAGSLPQSYFAALRRPAGEAGPLSVPTGGWRPDAHAGMPPGGVAGPLGAGGPYHFGHPPMPTPSTLTAALHGGPPVSSGFYPSAALAASSATMSTAAMLGPTSMSMASAMSGALPSGSMLPGTMAGGLPWNSVMPTHTHGPFPVGMYPGMQPSAAMVAAYMQARGMHMGHTAASSGGGSGASDAGGAGTGSISPVGTGEANTMQVTAGATMGASAAPAAGAGAGGGFPYVWKPQKKK